MSPTDPLLVWMAAALLAVLLAHAALAKWTDLLQFEQHLAAYGVPGALLGLARLAIPLAETAAAAALLSPWRVAGAVLAAALLLVYGAAMAWHRAHGRALDCGCGGEPLPLSWALVARNAVLALVAALAAMPMTVRALALADFFVIAGAVVLGTLLLAALHQVLRQRSALVGHAPRAHGAPGFQGQGQE